MRQELARTASSLARAELRRICGYAGLPAQSSRHARNAARVSHHARGPTAQALFRLEGMRRLPYRSSSALAGRLKGKTLTESRPRCGITRPGWRPRRRQARASTEMRELLSYLWAEQFFEDSGNPDAGRRVFTAKHCATCHDEPLTGAPKLAGAGRSFNGGRHGLGPLASRPAHARSDEGQRHLLAAFRTRANVRPDRLLELGEGENTMSARAEASDPGAAHQPLDQHGWASRW